MLLSTVNIYHIYYIIGYYGQKFNLFDWSIAEKELDYMDGDEINIGWNCFDRICQKGMGDKTALYYENYDTFVKVFS